VDLPNIHVLHTHDHVVVITQEGAVEVDDKLRVAVVHDLEFPHNAAAHLLLGLDVDDLGETYELQDTKDTARCLPFSP
jgi:hypothetical protein